MVSRTCQCKMSSSGHGASAWSASSTVGPLAASLGDTLSQSRTQHHPGYMMVRFYSSDIRYYSLKWAFLVGVTRKCE